MIVEHPPCNPLRRAAQEAISVGLGFGILGFQRVQVKRREWEQMNNCSIPSPNDLSQRVTAALDGVSSLIAQFGRR